MAVMTKMHESRVCESRVSITNSCEVFSRQLSKPRRLAGGATNSTQTRPFLGYFRHESDDLNSVFALLPGLAINTFCNETFIPVCSHHDE
jgi:hypothetical protein